VLTTSALSVETLASVLDQSVDCVKLIGLDGSVRWMNANGLCAMEIDDFSAVKSRHWADLWPDEARPAIMKSLASATQGAPVRFDAYCPTAKGTPRWWNVTVSRVQDVSGEQAGYLAISRDITEAETGRQALEIAAAELRHRLKNTYAMIGSLLLGFARGNPDREAFAHEMTGRLVALSTAQALFSTQDAPRELAALLPALVTPFDRSTCSVVIGELPDTLVTQGQADAIALVLGELAVNAAKHGALASGGSLHLSARAADGGLEIVWDEKSVGEVAAHDRSGGQGLKLIDRIVRARQGALDIAWHDRGVTVTLRFPIAAGRA
jgi:two-component sensor histidine kinase